MHIYIKERKRWGAPSFFRRLDASLRPCDCMFKHTIAWLMDIFIFDEICISTLDNVKRMGALIGASSAPSLEDSLCHGSRPDL